MTRAFALAIRNSSFTNDLCVPLLRHEANPKSKLGLLICWLVPEGFLRRITHVEPGMSLPNYNPNPLDTSQIKLPEDLARLTELLAENAHEVWAKERSAQGWKWGPHRDDSKKEHPNLVPYKQLSEEEKAFDRQTATETIKTIFSMGYGRRAGTIDTNFVLSDTNRKVVSELRKPKLVVSELRRLWEERVPSVWRNVEIYRRAVDAALKLGESFLAFDVATEGLELFKGDLRLTQLQALALARTGATRRANEILEQLRLSGHQDEETLGILARTHKDFWLISTDLREKSHHLKMSFSLYAEAYRRNRGYYSGVNAAATAFLSGQKDIAYQLAHEIAEICRAMLESLDVESEERYWVQATMAECYLIQAICSWRSGFIKTLATSAANIGWCSIARVPRRACCWNLPASALTCWIIVLNFRASSSARGTCSIRSDVSNHGFPMAWKNESDRKSAANSL